MAESGVLIESMANSVKFYPATWLGLTAYGQTPYWRTIQPWQSDYQQQPYMQKVCYGDILTIQLHVPAMEDWHLATYGPRLFICDEGGNELVADLQAVPRFKGYQFIGNTDINPITNVVNVLIDACWSFKMGDFFSSTHGALNNVYCIRCDYYEIGDDNEPADKISAFSEPMLLADWHENTQQYISTYNTNNKKFEVIQGGWYDNYPDNTIPWPLQFGVRVESFAIPSRTGPKGVNIGYLQQSYRQVQNQTNILLPVWDLKVGENGLGIPWYMLEKLTACMFADAFALLNMGDELPFGYKVYNTNSGTSPTDIWKVRSFNDVDSLLKASCQLQQTAGRGLYTPTPSPITTYEFARPDFYGTDFA